MGNRDDDRRPGFDLTTPNIRLPNQPQQGGPPQPSWPQQEGGDFDRTNVNFPPPRQQGGRPPQQNPGPRNQFDLTSVNLNMPQDDYADDWPQNRSAPPPPQQQQYAQQQQHYQQQQQQYAPQYQYQQQQQQYYPQQQQQQPPAGRKRRVPLWLLIVGGSLLAILLAAAVGVAVYFLTTGSTFTLRVLDAPRGSRIYVDDVPTGISQTDGSILVKSLKIEEPREVRVTNEGYADWRTTVKGKAGEVKELRVRLTPLSEPPKEAPDDIAKDLEEMGRARIYGINFDVGSDRIKEESRPTLAKIVNTLQKNPDLKLIIEGHTDSTASPQYNQQLSERRSLAVKNFLLTAGVAPGRLATVGYGASKPVATNDTEQGRALNRRVELIKQ